MTVISLAAAREERQPHWRGLTYCVGCHHEWEGAAPMGTAWVDCPSCGLPKGTPKYPFGPQNEDLLYVCIPCGGEAFTAYKRRGRFYFRCMGCGLDQTEGIFG
jgi:DNA-directed RNA polymerase subunit RPC12/RpoP